MRFALIFVIILSAFTASLHANEFDKNSTVTNPVPIGDFPLSNSIPPQIVPPYQFGNLQQPIFGSSPCTSGCNQQGVSCPGYCGQFPGLCNQNCQQQQGPAQTVTVKVPVRVTKTVPEKVTRTVQKQPKFVKIPMKSERMTQCPENQRYVKDENGVEQCLEEGPVDCPFGFEFRNERCIKTVTTCANEHTKIFNECRLRTMCPHNYIQEGEECVAPEPQCPFGWNWNGRFCEPERYTCPSGYVLGRDNQCKHEITRCPPNYRDYGDQCIKEEPDCPYGYSMNPVTRICEKSIANCPPGSYVQNGECVNVTYECPPGSVETDGNLCKIEQMVNKVVHEIKYVPQTMTIPGAQTTSCGNYQGGCGSTPCGNSPCLYSQGILPSL